MSFKQRSGLVADTDPYLTSATRDSTVDCMDESKVNTESLVTDAPVAQRREEVSTLNIRLRQEEQVLHQLLQRLDTAEAMAHLVVPRSFRGQCQGWLAADRQATESSDVDPYVQAFVEDLSTYAALTGMRGAIQSLLANNRRFGMVLDLILAAMPLVETNTQRMAKGCVDAHMQQCEAVKQQLHVLLHNFPRSTGHLAQRFSGPVA